MSWIWILIIAYFLMEMFINLVFHFITQWLKKAETVTFSEKEKC